MDHNLPSGTHPRTLNIRAILIILLAIGLLIAAIIYALNRNRTADEVAQDEQRAAEEREELDDDEVSIAPNTFVYGTWNGQSAFIRSYDLDTDEVETLAQLNEKIKKVTVLNANQILYIYNTNAYDHGRDLVVYSRPEEEEYSVYQASEGFGIDDYVVSPNGRYVATWEVAFKEGQGRLAGGRSRVYVARVDDPEQKHLLYDEVQTGDTPVHYPLAVTNDGDVFTDQFLPGTIHGWGYGMSYATFDGSVKEDIETMKDGMYGSQPVFSPDGRYLAFTGYTSPRAGVSKEERPRQRAGANTITLLDLQSRETRNLANIPTSESYIDVRWDGSDLIYYAIGQAGTTKTGYYRYNTASQTAKQIAVEDISTDWPVGTLGNGKILVGVDEMDSTSLGNLGNRYAPPFTSMYLINEDGSFSELDGPSGFVQYISLLPGGYFAEGEAGTVSVLAKDKDKKKKDKNDKKDNKKKDKKGSEKFKEDSTCEGYDNLQLCPFYFKASLEQVREKTQTIPACYDGLIGPECERRGHAYRSEAWRACVRELVKPYRHAGLCGGSPLYLYGDKGASVSVTFGTDIFGATPSYKGVYNVTLLGNGKMGINGGSFDRISYDYTPAIRTITPPTRGRIVAKRDVPATLREYGAKLGLNEKEVEDLVAYGTQQVISPYVFLSFFDQKTSEQILPISFKPQPDNYRNIVFYFRLLSGEPPVTVEEPVFPQPLKRTGFTAVEVSGFVQ